MKSRIIEELGQAELMLPNLVAGALQANGRAKLRMSVLQAAARHAHDPHGEPPDLTSECSSAGIDAVAIRSLVAGARADGAGVIEAPGLASLNETLLQDVETMIAAVGAGDPQAGETARQRFAAIGTSLGSRSEHISEADIAKLTSAGGDGTDSLHRLVMDLHKDLNRLTAQWAEENVGGALAYGLDPDDKPLISAFMRGLDRTRRLKFDHPGLDTTAVRGENRLLIQNDIGTTDAHVLVVVIEGLTATITHSDVHEARAKFFIGLFEPFAVEWSRLRQTRADALAEGESFYLVTGRYQAKDKEALENFLEAVGAALVFLIDWNKARKSLRRLVGNSDAVHLLDWAARHEIGHRAFLELGGTDLVASAVRHAAPARIGFGDELSDVLGREATLKFLKSALRLSTEALHNGKPVRSVREMLEADLVQRIERNETALLTTVVRQLGLARDIAAGIAKDIADGRLRTASAVSNAARAKSIEEKADAIALDARQTIARTEASPIIIRLVDAAENTIDELEQAAFLASLLPAGLQAELASPLGDLCANAIYGTEAAVRGLEAAASFFEGNSSDSDDALQAAARLVDIEHAADESERSVARIVLGGGASGERNIAALELARSLERATDRLALVGHVLHNHVMVGLSG